MQIKNILIAFVCGGLLVSVTVLETMAAETEQSLISFSAGAMVVLKPAEYSEGWSGFWMFDERPDTGWASPEGQTEGNVVVVELAEKTLLKRLEFDTGKIDGPGRGAKDVLVEISDEGPAKGFRKIGEMALADAADGQQFPVSAEIAGRWLRLTIGNNNGAPDYTELMEFRGYGSQLTQTPFPDSSGTYETDYNDFHLRQQGTTVTGCYEYNKGELNGGIEGRIMKFTWTEDERKGPAVIVFSGDGKSFFGLWWHEGGEDEVGGIWTGTLKSREVGGCPQWSGGAQEEMAKELAESGRIRLYGINFDVDRAVIRDESKPTLDKVAAMLKADADMQLIIEGHTDSSGNAERNQELSKHRAAAVKTHLITAGIADDRLSTDGFGADRPVATNDSGLGRAQNRRVELVKK